MDQDVPMEDANPQQNDEATGDDLAKYNLDDYDDEDAMPGACALAPFRFWIL